MTGRVCYQRGCPVTTSVNFSPNIALASLRLFQGLLRLLLITLHFSVVSTYGIKITHYIQYNTLHYILHYKLHYTFQVSATEAKVRGSSLQSPKFKVVSDNQHGGHYDSRHDSTPWPSKWTVTFCFFFFLTKYECDWEKIAPRHPTCYNGSRQVRCGLGEMLLKHRTL